FFRPTVSSPMLTTSFISLASTIPLRASHWRRRPSSGRFAFVQMRVKRIWRMREIFIMASSIMVALWLSWRLLNRPCLMTRANSGAIGGCADEWLNCALAERDVAAAKDVLNTIDDTPLTDYSVHPTRLVIEGVLARMTKNDGDARALFMAARTQQEKTVQAEPNYGPALCVLGLIDAGLGRREEALREGRRAVELVPVEKDALVGPTMIKYLAMIAAWTGDKDLACEQLAIAVRPPSTVSYGQLKLLPFWDPLRGDPRF